MLSNILNLEGVTTMNKTAQQSVQGGNGGILLDCSSRSGGSANACGVNEH